MDSDLHINKRARLNAESMSSISRSTDIDTFSKMSYSPEAKPLPMDLNEFLANPYNFRVTDEFLSRITLDDRESPLIHCIKIQNEGAVDVMMRCKIDPNACNSRGVTPISAAAHKGYVPIMRLLIDAGAFVNAVNQSGSTALIQAAHFGHYQAVAMLLEERANPHFANSKGTTALMRASQEGHVSITKALIDAGVDVNRRNLEGMNALMLASQRGHAEIVMILIEAGAAKDEQTAQGSTALMLACKRGHEKCAEVLVSMGAEIFMRDRRYRTARDTALRRNHTGLLVWLDTQVQVVKIQERHQQKRMEVIKEIRTAYLENKLKLCPMEEFVSELVTAVKDTTAVANGTMTFKLTPARQEQLTKQDQLIKDFLQSAPHLPIQAKAPEQTLKTIRSVLAGDYAAAASRIPVYRNSSRPAVRVRDYADWMWPMVFQRALTLPNGVFENVMEFLPLPRVWSWSLSHMLRRCRLAAQQTVVDLTTLIDEILCDSCVVGDDVQKQILVKIARSPQMHDLLIEHYGITPPFLEKLCTWSDVQSAVSRFSPTENELEYKFLLTKQLLYISIYVFRWFRMRNNAMSSLGLTWNVQHLMDGSASSYETSSGKRTTFVDPVYGSFEGRGRIRFNSSGTSAASAITKDPTAVAAVPVAASPFQHFHQQEPIATVVGGGLDPEEVNLLEVTDPGHNNVDVDSEVVLMMEPDTETELHLGGEGEDAADDSDNDQAPLPLPPAPPAVAAVHVAAGVIPPFPLGHGQGQGHGHGHHLTAHQQLQLQQHQHHLQQLHVQQQQQLQLQFQQQQQQQLQQQQMHHNQHHHHHGGHH